MKGNHNIERTLLAISNVQIGKETYLRIGSNSKIPKYFKKNLLKIIFFFKDVYS